MTIKLVVPLIFLFILPAAANGQKKIDGISGGIVNGRAIVLPKPDYPAEARDFCARGKVEIEVLISEKGDVVEARVISGDELLRAVSIEAARGAKFGPTHGLPVKVRGIIVYNFDSLAKSFANCINVGVVNTKALKLPPPKIPNLNQSNHVRIAKEEIVAVQIVIDMAGKVIGARAVSGNPLLSAASVSAARRAEFPPTLINTRFPLKIGALLVYKFKPDGSVETIIEKDDKDVIKTPVILIKPPFTSCNCEFGSASPKVVVVAEIDEQGNVSKAKAVSGHPVLRTASERSTLSSKFLPLNIKSKLFITYIFSKVDKRSVRISEVEIKTPTS